MYIRLSFPHLAAALALGVLVLPATGSTHAASSRLLTAADFFSTQHVFNIGDPAADATFDTPTVAGTRYTSGVFMGSLGNCRGATPDGYGSLNMARYPGATTFAAEIGVGDDSTPASSMRLTITGDDKTLYSHPDVACILHLSARKVGNRECGDDRRWLTSGLGCGDGLTSLRGECPGRRLAQVALAQLAALPPVSIPIIVKVGGLPVGHDTGLPCATNHNPTC